jgi:putative phosphoribosyl transferase
LVRAGDNTQDVFVGQGDANQLANGQWLNRRVGEAKAVGRAIAKGRDLEVLPRSGVGGVKLRRRVGHVVIITAWGGLAVPSRMADTVGMYFRDRTQAGELLASQLLDYRLEPTAVLALSAGGVAVGEPIARRLGCPLSLMLTARIAAPGDPALVLGTLDQEGEFFFNDLIPAGQMEEYMQEMRGFLEEEKLHKLYDMASLVGKGGFVNREELKGRNIILVTDGVKNGLSFDGAMHFLKPVHTERVIGAVPVGPAEVVERLARKCYELHYLYIPDNFIKVGHYYEDNSLPDPGEVIQKINNSAARWSRQQGF